MTHTLLALNPADYQRHRLHTQERNWAETNCYVDVWIELLHAWELEPVAALPFTVAIDFEGDQWTFFKFPHADLLELFGLDVQELAIWRPLAVHIEEQLALGRPLLVELDSYFLPDTAGTSYRREHVKSTVVAMDIDRARRRLGYFHGQGYYQLAGDDFDGVLRLNESQPTSMLPPYVEIVKRRSDEVPRGAELAAVSLSLLRRHLERMPQVNPFDEFKQRFERDWPWLADAPLEVFHQYSFATLRQFGSCYELAANYLNWLDGQCCGDFAEPAAAFASLSTGAKTMQFQLARAMARKRMLDLAALDAMAGAWQAATSDLKNQLR